MAASRVTRSMVDWTAALRKVGAEHRQVLQQVKAKSEHHLGKISQLPEKLPQIDFAFYKRQLANQELVDRFQKMYSQLTIAYPKDQGNVTGQVDQFAKDEALRVQKAKAESNKRIKGHEDMLVQARRFPPLEEWTVEMAVQYIPENLTPDIRKDITTFPPHEDRREDPAWWAKRGGETAVWTKPDEFHHLDAELTAKEAAARDAKK